MAAAAGSAFRAFLVARSGEGRTADPESEEMRMIRRISSVAVALAVSLGAASAGAQAAPGGFGSSGQFTIGAERMFGFNSASQKTETEVAGVTATTTVSSTQFSLLGFNGTYPEISPYAHPRIGFDFFVIDRLSVGGSLAFMTTSTEIELEQGGQSASNDGPSTSTFLFAPRAGYAIMFNDMIGIWPRLGFTYYSTTSEQETPAGTFEDSENGLALSIEGLFVIAPVQNFGFTVGPTIDLGLTGGYDDEGAPPGSPALESDRTVTDFGIHAGLAVWF